MTDREAIEAIEIVLGSDYNYDETIGYQLTSDDFEWMEMAKVALQERIDRKKGCEWCIGFCPDVTGDPYADCRFCPMCGRKLKTAMPGGGGGGGRVDHECSLSRM